jgi:hypothetical protein
MKHFFRRTMSGLVPADDEAEKALRGVKPGVVVAVEVTRPRNIQHHRLYWAMCSKIANAIEAEPENISDVLKLKTGHFVTVQTKGGPVHLPRSISFAKMDQGEFREFFERCCRVISMEWLPHMSARQVQSEILEMMGVTLDSEAA